MACTSTVTTLTGVAPLSHLPCPLYKKKKESDPFAGEKNNTFYSSILLYLLLIPSFDPIFHIVLTNVLYVQLLHASYKSWKKSSSDFASIFLYQFWSNLLFQFQSIRQQEKQEQRPPQRALDR